MRHSTKSAHNELSCQVEVSYMP